jgi:type II secretory pathway component GspD/PulD (secretin)
MRTRHSRRDQQPLPAILASLGFLTAWLLMLGAALCHAGTADVSMVAVDFENVELRVFIKFVSEVTGRIFLVDDHVRGQVSVRFANKIPIDELYEVLTSVLEVKGFAAVPAGHLTKIVPIGSAKQRGLEVGGGGSLRPSERR